MPDQFETLFAELRAETVAEVRPPGVGAARRTVRRRRTTRTVTAAAAVLALAGGVTAVTLPDRAPRDGSRTGQVAAARQAAGLPGGETVDGPVTPRTGVGFPDLPPATYTLSLACSGQGTLTMRPGQTLPGRLPVELGEQVATCAAAPQPVTLTVRLPAPGELTVLLQGDARASGTADYALSLVNVTAEAGNPPGTESIGNARRAYDMLGERAVAVTTEQSGQTVSYERPGEYRLRYACAGPGTVEVEVTRPAEAGQTPFSRTVECTDDGQGVLPLSIRDGQRLILTIAPDLDARNKAGFAFEWEPA